MAPRTDTRPPVAPIDPDTPAGLAAAEALTQALGEVYAALAARRQPRPTPPPQAPRPPAGPLTPSPPAGPRTTQDAA